MGEGREMGGWEGGRHLGEKKLPKQLPGFIWPATVRNTRIHSLSLFRTHTGTPSLPPRSPPPSHVLERGPHRGVAA